jgi:acyl carrier protein
MTTSDGFAFFHSSDLQELTEEIIHDYRTLNETRMHPALSSFSHEVGMDSLDVVELVMEVEDEINGG